MTDPNEQVRIDTEDVRAGATPHVTRYVLGISLVLVVIVFAWLFIR